MKTVSPVLKKAQRVIARNLDLAQGSALPAEAVANYTKAAYYATRTLLSLTKDYPWSKEDTAEEAGKQLPDDEWEPGALHDLPRPKETDPIGAEAPLRAFRDADIVIAISRGTVSVLKSREETGRVLPNDELESGTESPELKPPKYRVWECKIVVPSHAEFPEAFDFPPRRAAIKAVENAGVEVISCFSGWGGSLTSAEEKAVARGIKVREGVA